MVQTLLSAFTLLFHTLWGLLWRTLVSIAGAALIAAGLFLLRSLILYYWFDALIFSDWHQEPVPSLVIPQHLAPMPWNFESWSEWFWSIFSFRYLVVTALNATSLIGIFCGFKILLTGIADNSGGGV